MTRREFPAGVKREAAARSGGVCECYRMSPDIIEHFAPGCTLEAMEFDHVFCDKLGGEPDLQNCAHLSKECHAKKTGLDRKSISVRARHKPDRERRDKRKANPSAKIQSRGFSKQKRGFYKPEGKKK